MGSPKQSLNTSSHNVFESSVSLQYLTRVGFHGPSDRPTEMNSYCSPVRRWKVDIRTFSILARSLPSCKDVPGAMWGGARVEWDQTVWQSTGLQPEATRLPYAR